jgi:hypothetical protein
LDNAIPSWFNRLFVITTNIGKGEGGCIGWWQEIALQGNNCGDDPRARKKRATLYGRSEGLAPESRPLPGNPGIRMGEVSLAGVMTLLEGISGGSPGWDFL